LGRSGGIGGRLAAKVAVRISAAGFSRALSSKIGKSFVSTDISVDEALDYAADYSDDEAEQLIFAGIRTAISAMEGFPVNSGQESILYGKIVPWFEALPLDPDQCAAEIQGAYYEFGDYLEFMSITIDTGVSIVEDAIVRAKFVQNVQQIVSFIF